MPTYVELMATGNYEGGWYYDIAFDVERSWCRSHKSSDRITVEADDYDWHEDSVEMNSKLDVAKEIVNHCITWMYEAHEQEYDERRDEEELSE